MCFPALLAAAPLAAEGAAVAATTVATAAAPVAATAGGMFGGMSGLQLIGQGFSLVSGLMKSQGEQDQANYEAGVARNNQKTAEYAAEDAKRRAEQEAQRVQRNASSTVGSQRAAFAAKGIDISDGTAADIIDQTNFFGQADANTARYNGKVEAWNKTTQASNFGAQTNAANSRASGLAVGGLLSGAGAVADKWYSYNKKAA